MGMQSVLSLPDRCEETTGGYDEGFRRGMAGNAHLYSHAAEGPLSGKISLKCTLGQPVLSEMAYYVRFKQGKRCRRVHFANISPEKPSFSAREYKIRRSCHCLARGPRVKEDEHAARSAQDDIPALTGEGGES